MEQPPDSPLSKDEIQRLTALKQAENAYHSAGYQTIAGVDEAGRGPLAGPVVAAVCVIPADVLIPYVDDSKKLSPSKRAALYQVLSSHPRISYGVGQVSSDEIDRINILQATILAMKQAIGALENSVDLFLVDGLSLKIDGRKTVKIIGGDSTCFSIAAASIIAKETRDRLMHTYHETWPQYGFDRHKGYGTEEHRAAIGKYGPCPIHRMTFEPLKSLAGK